MNIKKYLAIFVLCFIMYGLLSTFNMKTVEGKADTLDEEIYEFYPAIEQFVYQIDEEFLIKIIVKSKCNVISLGYESEGFIITKNPSISNEIVIICVKCDGTTYNPILTIKANLEDGQQLVAKVYGVIENNTLYINGNSFDIARDICFSEMLNNSIMDESEYEDMLIQNNASCFSETSFVSTSSTPLSVSGGVVKGRLRWKDNWGNFHPLQYTKVSIFDDDPLLDDNMGIVYTNSDGEFNFSFDDNLDDIADSSGRDIYIKVWPEGANSVVKSGSNNKYVIRSETNMNVATGSTTTINLDIDMSTDLGRAFQISQAIITASQYASEMVGKPLEKVTVQYPTKDASNGCYYSSFNKTIYICGNRGDDDYEVNGQILRSYESWDVMMHEYGHFVQDQLKIEDNPGGTHFGNVNMYDHYMEHHNGGMLTTPCNNKCAKPSPQMAKEYAIKITYAEAWATVFGAMAQKYYVDLGQLDSSIPTVGDEKYESYNGAYINYNVGSRAGEAMENAVIGILWNIFDNSVDAYDNLSIGHNGWWNLTVSGSPKTFSEMANQFYLLYSNRTLQESFYMLLEHFGMAPTEITEIGSLVSHTAPTFTWTAKGTSNHLQNNSFRVIIYDSNHSVVLDLNTTNTNITLTQEQWNSIIYSGSEKFYISVGGKQTDEVETGYYYSALKEFTKPLFQTTLSNGTITVSGYYSWTPSKLFIEQMYNGIIVSNIGPSAFLGCTNLTNVSFFHTVTSIGANAFERCTNLTSVFIVGGLLTIGDSAFKDCISLTDISIPKSTTIIGASAFEGCIGLTSMVIPNTVTSIGLSAFKNCNNLISITLPFVGESVNGINNTHFGYIFGSSALDTNNYYIPSKLKNVVLTSCLKIKDYSFYDCRKLESVTLPSTLTNIGSFAFKGCTNLTSLNIPNTVIGIGISAFENCIFLENVVLSSNLTNIGTSSFKGCTKLNTITIPNSVTSIGESSFEGCIDLEGIILLPGLLTIGNNTFKGCTSLTSASIPNSVTSIGSNAFEGCSHLQTLILPNNLTTINNSTFKGCVKLTIINIPNSVTSIGNSAFEGCIDLEGITLPPGLLTIGNNAFKGCTSLTSVSIPNTVTSIESNAFEGCSHLQTLILPNNLTTINNSTFKGCVKLTTINIPNSVTIIGSSAFEGDYRLQTLTLSNSLITIGNNAFKGCRDLSILTIPSSVEQIGEEAFMNCSTLSNVTIERAQSELTILGENVFSGCSSILEIIVPMHRIAEYKNKQNWSSYKNKITTQAEYQQIHIDCEQSINKSISLNAGYNQLYQLQVDCSKAYKINTSALSTVTITVYDGNMNVIDSGSNLMNIFLSDGTYYVSIEFTDRTVLGTIETNISLR